MYQIYGDGEVIFCNLNNKEW